MDSENNETQQVETQTTEAPAVEQTQEEAIQDAAPETEGTEAEARAEDGAEEPEGEDSEGEQQKPGDKKHRRKGGWERKIERLEWELERLRATQQPQPQQPQQAEPAREQTPEEKAAAYVQTMIQQGIAAERMREQQQAAAMELQEREAKAQAKYGEDYSTAVNRFAVSRVPASHIQALLTSEHGPDIMVSIAKDPDALARFRALPPAQAFLEVGRWEAKLASETATPASPKPVKRPPPPPTTVGGSTKSTGDLVDLPIAEYKRRLRSR